MIPVHTSLSESDILSKILFFIKIKVRSNYAKKVLRSFISPGGKS